MFWMSSIFQHPKINDARFVDKICNFSHNMT